MQMAELRKLIGTRIRSVRKQKGLTMQELSQRAKIQYNYLGDVERGDRNISIDILEKIVTALDIHLRELLDYSEVDIDQDALTLQSVLEIHRDFLKTKNIDDVRMLHRVAQEIFKSIEKNSKS